MIFHNLKFRTRLLLSLSILLGVTTIGTVFYIQLETRKIVREKVEIDFKNTSKIIETSFDNNISLLKKTIRLAISNPLFITQLNRLQASDEDIGLGEELEDRIKNKGKDKESSSSKTIKNVHSIFKSTKLELFNKYPLLVIIDSSSTLVFSKQAPYRYGDNLSSIEMIEKTLEGETQVSFISSRDKQWSYLGITSKEKNKTYMVTTQYINSGREIIGMVIAGIDVSQDFLPYLEKISRSKIVLSSKDSFTSNNSQFIQAAKSLKKSKHLGPLRISNTKHKGDDYFSMFIPVTRKGEPIADLFIFRSQESELKKINDKLSEIAIAVLIISLSLGFVFITAISKGLSRPLSLLLSAIMNIKNGKYGETIKLKRRDEIGILADEFSDMSVNLKESYDQIKKYNQNLEKMVEDRTRELKESQGKLIQAEKMASLGQLVAGVAHEINTPVGLGVTSATYFQSLITTIDKKMHDNQIKKSDLNTFFKESAECASIILKNLTRTAELVKSFKQVSVDQMVEERRSFLLKEYLENIFLTINPELKKGNHRYETDCPETLELFTFPGALSQVFTNLIMNSIIHGFKNKTEQVIKIKVIKNNQDVVIDYYDSGKGIDKEIMGKVFDPFTTTARGEGGTGLGLHISYNIVTQTLNGTLSCGNNQKGGAHFKIEFTETSPSVGEA